jgi:hypothetical protein
VAALVARDSRDVYIGEESGVDFTDGPSYATLSGARLMRE